MSSLRLLTTSPFLPLPLPLLSRPLISKRPFSSTTSLLSSSKNDDDSDNVRSSPPPPPFTGPRPSPLKLSDPKEQAIFEDLVSRSTGSFSTSIDERARGITRGMESLNEAVPAAEEERHPDAPKEVRVEFEGERNPATGEVGGPKDEPLKWGGEGEWTYNGRATDF